MAPSRSKHYRTLVPQIEALVYELFNSEYVPKTRSPEEIQDLIRCPVVKAPLTVIALLGLSYFGEYTHENEEIQKFVRSNLEGLRGSFRVNIAQLFSSVWLGHAVANWGVVPKDKEWVLDKIITLRPGSFGFHGTLGQIEFVRYHGVLGDIDIPYEQILHVIHNQHLLFNDPGGLSDLDSAFAAVKAWQILINNMVVAGDRQATPLTGVFYDPDAQNIPAENEDGSPKLNDNGDQIMIKPQEQIAEAVKDLENRTVVITSKLNDIRAIANQADVNFWKEALAICHKLIYLSLLFPETGLEALGSGDSNLNKGHMALLGKSIEHVAGLIKEEILEKMIRPLITWNFGEQDSYGDFPAAPGKEEQRIELMTALISAFSGQILTLDDLDALNKLRELAGLPLWDKLPEPPEEEEAPIPTDEDEVPEEEPPDEFGLTRKDLLYWSAIANGNGKTHA